MTISAHPKYKKLMKDIEAYCSSQGWVFEGRFKETVEAHLDMMIGGLLQQMGIEVQSFWITYGHLVKADQIANRVHTAMASSDSAHASEDDVHVSIATAARVLVSLGSVPRSVADGRATLRTKGGLVEGMGILTMAGDAVSLIALAINEAAEAGSESVLISGEAAYKARTSLTETVQKIQSGTWTTGAEDHDELLIEGISSDRDLLVPSGLTPHPGDAD